MKSPVPGARKLQRVEGRIEDLSEEAGARRVWRLKWVGHGTWFGKNIVNEINSLQLFTGGAAVGPGLRLQGKRSHQGRWWQLPPLEGHPGSTPLRCGILGTHR